MIAKIRSTRPPGCRRAIVADFSDSGVSDEDLMFRRHQFLQESHDCAHAHELVGAFVIGGPVGAADGRQPSGAMSGGLVRDELSPENSIECDVDYDPKGNRKR